MILSSLPSTRFQLRAPRDSGSELSRPNPAKSISVPSFPADAPRTYSVLCAARTTHSRAWNDRLGRMLTECTTPRGRAAPATAALLLWRATVPPKTCLPQSAFILSSDRSFFCSGPLVPWIPEIANRPPGSHDQNSHWSKSTLHP